jgi:hypothetical protein
MYKKIIQGNDVNVSVKVQTFMCKSFTLTRDFHAIYVWVWTLTQHWSGGQDSETLIMPHPLMIDSFSSEMWLTIFPI